MKKISLIAVLLVCGYVGLKRCRLESEWQKPVSIIPESAGSASSGAIVGTSQDGRQMEGTGTVVRILPDDLDGSRHQRFILKLGSGQTVLVAHNIDIAPRVSNLRVGDTVGFKGQFVSNPKGGVIHWTHHDPRGRHASGHLTHNGQVYQ